MPLRVKEEGMVLWDFKGKESSSKGDERGKCFINKCLPCPVRDWATERNVNRLC